MKKRNEIIGLPVKDFDVRSGLARRCLEIINQRASRSKKACFAVIPFDGSELIRFENWWDCEDYADRAYDLINDAVDAEFEDIDGYCGYVLFSFVYMWSEKHNLFVVDMSERSTGLDSCHERICGAVMDGLKSDR